MDLLELAAADDREAVMAITRQVNDLHVSWRPDIFRQAENLYPEEYFLEDIRNKALYVARLDGALVGYVCFHIWETNSDASVPSKVLDIDDITVDAKYRHQGIGQRIMADIREIAGERGCNDIQLSVYPQNENAVRFYEKCGFRVRNIRYQMYI